MTKIEELLKGHCEWCMAQGGYCQARLDGCSVFDALAQLAEPCEWKWYGGNQWWGTNCGNIKRAFMGGSTIEENGYRFCPFCGRRIKEIR